VPELPWGVERGVPHPPGRGLGRVLIFGSKWAVFCSKFFCIQAKEGGIT